MIYSNACEYAIRALTYLARKPEGKMCMLREISEREGIPYHYLGKILQNLVRQGFVVSAKGRNGGFALARSAEAITLYEIKRSIDGVADLGRCAVGLDLCTDENPCPQHDLWGPLRLQIENYLQDTALADMARAVKEKQAVIDGGKS